MNPISPTIRRLALTLMLVLLAAGTTAQAQIARFVGDYSGSAEVETADGSREQRDMGVSIQGLDDGFAIRWSSTIQRGGKATKKTYAITFVPSDRTNVYSAAMTRNVFGHEVPLDPMKGEPYVWARIDGDRLTVFSLIVGDDGSYEMQQYDRTLVDGGLQLDFSRIREGKALRVVSTLLRRQ